MGFYSQYRGRSCGRILAYLEKYCGLRVAEEATVHGDKVTWWGETIATYTWDENSDIATFVFNPGLNRSVFNPKYWTRNQRIYKPYFDRDRFDSPLNYNYEFILQEVRSQIENLGLPLTRDEVAGIIEQYSFGHWIPTESDLEFVVSVAETDIRESR